MAEVAALHLDELSPQELIATGQRLVEGLEGNAHFPEPQPPIDELRQKLAVVETTYEAYRKERLRLNELKNAYQAAMTEAKKAITLEAGYVDEASDGDAKKILSANLTPERTWSFWPFGSLAEVVELSASRGDLPGEVDLVWDAVRGADGYEINTASDMAGEGPWIQAAVSSESRVTVKDLQTGRRYWFRVRAVGSKGEGDWSDPVMKFAR